MRKIHKPNNKNSKNNYLKYIFVFLLIFLIMFFGYKYFEKNKITELQDAKLKILFTGDIFLDRHIDELTQKDNKINPKKYSYPFSDLKTLDKNNYDVWIGNLECPVTVAQSTPYEKENYLKFSCKPEYLNQLSKYFEIVSLANNHTNNSNGEEGLIETRKHLNDAGIKYFGDFDNSKTSEVCKIVFIKHDNYNLPIALCGFHGVFSLPTDKELAIIKDYSKYFVTIIMSHQGVEYEPTSNTYQKLIYRKMIDNGADSVIGSHPHVIEEVEQYKGKLIFYSLGNFIFDQSWQKTREHMEVDTEINFPKYADNYRDLETSCAQLSSLDCLQKAENLKIFKPGFIIKYKPIFTISGLDFITKKWDMPNTQYQKMLQIIGFDKVNSLFKE